MKSKALFSVDKEELPIPKKDIAAKKEISDQKELSPFDLLKSLFQSSDLEWDSIPKNQKAKNWFIINRILSRGYPVQAQVLNYNGISTDLAVDFWRMKLKGKFIPRWIWAKSISEKQVIEKKRKKVSDELLLIISKFYQCSIADLLNFQDLYPDDFDVEIKKFENLQKYERS